MTGIKKLIQQLISRQSGAALVAVLGAITVVVAFGVTVTATVTRNSNESNRDRSVKRALATAEAGIQEATHRLNMLQPGGSSPCVELNGGQFVTAAAPGEGQWCAAQTVDLGDGATVSYQVSPYSYENGVVTRSVVATGTVNGVTRRVEATSSANTGAPLFDAFGIASDKTLTLDGHATSNSSVRSNNDIVMNGNAIVCGDGTASATPGPGYSVSMGPNTQVCGSTAPAPSVFVLNPVDQGNAVTSNDNDRFFDQDPKTGTVTWDAESRELSLSGSGTLTLGGGTYSLCNLSASGSSQLIVGADATVRIFIDATSNCGYQASTNQLSVSGNAQIINTSQDPSKLQIYMMGGNAQTFNDASITGNGSTQFSLYAPFTDLSISGNGASVAGALVAGQVTVSGNGMTVAYDSRVSEISQTTIGVYRRQNYVECRSTNPGGSPDSAC